MSDDPSRDDLRAADAATSPENEPPADEVRQEQETSEVGQASGHDEPPVSGHDDELPADETGTRAVADLPGSLDVPAAIDPAAVTRLAQLHLRMGLYTLARAELEALRALASIDDEGLEALAEACWRTGDLAAAGRVAVPMAQAGSSRPIILVIGAEAIAAQGRPGEAGRLVGLAMEVIDVPLDALFAGLPRHASWPAVVPDEHVASSVGSVPVAVVAEAGSSAAAEAYAGGRAALAAGDAARAALEMGVALRLDPGFATEVLDVIGTRATEPGLLLVAGDALRILGREQEALAAFDIARGAAALVADAAAAGPPGRDVAADGTERTDAGVGSRIGDEAAGTVDDATAPATREVPRTTDPGPEIDPAG